MYDLLTGILIIDVVAKLSFYHNAKYQDLGDLWNHYRNHVLNKTFEIRHKYSMLDLYMCERVSFNRCKVLQTHLGSWSF